jgi:hypothetical protein
MLRRRIWVLLTALLSGAGCASLGVDPGGAYRDTLGQALANRSCSPSRTAAVFTAYEGWYRIAAGEPDHYVGAEADVLLSQAEAFRSIGCDEAARVSYQEVLRRFASDAFSGQRERAIQALQALPPPYPISQSPIRRT